MHTTTKALLGRVHKVGVLLLGALLLAALFAPALLADDVADLRQKAEQGDAHAQCDLGWMYGAGRGVPQDDQQAVEWYRKAAEQGYAQAQFNLGWMYGNGRGVPQDDQQAVEWYRKAAEQGHAHAQCHLGWMYENGRGVPQDDQQAVEWYRKAAEQEYADAQSHLGWMYGAGRGVPQDDQQAVEWYRKAAEQGHALAQFNLGWRYENGRGVPQDDQRVVEWYRKAAEQGHADAQYNLGWRYENGRGVPKDARQAVEWYKKAAEQGHADAQAALRRLEPGADQTRTPPPPPAPVTWMNADLVERACVFVVTSAGNTGTGFFVAPGYVATNQHVVQDFPEVQVGSRALDGFHRARVLATDRSNKRDYAVLQVDMPPHVAIEPLIFAAGAQRAEGVGAWGFPGVYGDKDPSYERFRRGDRTAIPEIVYTPGAVSNIIDTAPPYILHTAIISPGNSGGPLVNTRGEVLGINSITYIDRVYDGRVTRETFGALSGQDLLAFLRKHGVDARSR